MKADGQDSSKKKRSNIHTELCTHTNKSVSEPTKRTNT